MVIESYVDCLPCIIKMADKMANKHIKNKKDKFIFMKEVLEIIGDINYNKSAPFVTSKIMKLLKEKTGIKDLYREEKLKYNKKLIELKPKFKTLVESSSNPLKLAVKLSIAGNIIDSGAIDNISINLVNEVIEQAEKYSLSKELYNKFIDDLKTKKNLLYLGDNTGEIVFDSILIEQIKKEYPKLNITFVTRGDYILNDITIEDAYDVNIDKWAKIIDNGSDLPGTDLEEVSKEFLEFFRDSQIIISKGQGNFESLPGTNKNVYYLFLCKCELLQKQLNKNKFENIFISEDQVLKLFSKNKGGNHAS